MVNLSPQVLRQRIDLVAQRLELAFERAEPGVDANAERREALFDVLEPSLDVDEPRTEPAFRRLQPHVELALGPFQSCIESRGHSALEPREPALGALMK